MSQISRFITGANSLDISADTGTGSPQNDLLNVVGGTNVTTSISDNTLTIESSGGVTSPSFEGDGGDTASPDSGVLQMAGGRNLTSSASSDTVTYDMDQTLTSLDTIRYNNDGSLETDQSDGDTYTLDAYDTDAGSYTTFITLTAGDPPTADLNVDTTIDGNAIYYASGPDVALEDGGTGIDASGATDGQLLIGGSTDNDLQLSTITGGNNLSVTNGNNSITLDVDGAVADTFSADSGSASPDSGSITIEGGDDISTSASGSTITINSSGGGGTALSWTTATDGESMSVNTGYIPEGSGSTEDVLFSNSDDRKISKHLVDFNMSENGTNTDATGNISALATDDSWLYAAWENTVYQIDPSDMSINATNTDANNNILALATDDSWVYAAGSDDTVRQIDPSDMSTNATNTDANQKINALATDDSWVYAAGSDETVRQIDPSDMSENATNTDATGSIQALATDGSWVYAGGFDDVVRQIDPSDMSENATNTDAGGSINALATDDSWVYAGGDDDTVRQIDPSDMSTNATNTDAGGSIQALATDSSWLYAAGSDDTIRQIDPSDMSTNATTNTNESIGVLATGSFEAGVSLTLPSTASVGDRIAIAGKSPSSWFIKQNSSQAIFLGDLESTTGTDGVLSGTNQYTAAELICITEDTEFVVRSNTDALNVG